VATAGVAWVAPEILAGEWVGADTLSAPPGVTEAPPKAQPQLATTGLDLKSFAGAGALAIGSGWAMHHWASRPEEGS
jgi:hypothetical protein